MSRVRSQKRAKAEMERGRKQEQREEELQKVNAISGMCTQLEREREREL